MADNNLSAPAEPDVTTPPTEAQLVDDLANLLEPPETDQPEEPEDTEAAPAPDDDPLGLEADDVEAEPADDPDGSDPEIKGGRFAPDTAKVTLDDGTVTTIADLKRGTLFQRDYTKKTTELKAEKEAFNTEREQVSQYAQSLNQTREYLAWYAENFVPKQPEPFNGAPDDYVGFIEWQRKQAEWQTHAQAFATFQQQKQAEDQRKAGETQQQAQARRQRESKALLDAMPILKDPVKSKPAWDALVAGAAREFGLSEAEVNAIEDHRILVGLRDALAYRRIKAKAPQVQAQVAAKPALKSGRRAPPNAQASRERSARTERLRNSGSLEDGIAALQDFDL